MKIFPDVLPIEIGVVLFLLALILTIAPFLPGRDFGVIRVPDFDHSTRSWLKGGGPLSLVLIILMFTVPYGNTDCGEMDEEYIVQQPTPKTCSHPSFGQEGWQYTQEVSGQSGWMRGGSSQVNWCNTLIANFLRDRSINSNHQAETVASGEDARWTGNFGRTREYNYVCTVKVSWQPIYGEQTDGNICGMTEPVMGVRRVPRPC